MTDDIEGQVATLIGTPPSRRAASLYEWLDAEAAAAPCKAKPPALRPGMAVAEAARAIYRECLSQILANLRCVLRSGDPEGPHQLRVGLRRLRAGLRLFRDLPGAAARARLDDEARRLGREVGALRDLDVIFLEMLQPAARTTPQEPGFNPLLAAVDRRRDEVREGLRETLLGKRCRDFLLALISLAAGELADDAQAMPDVPIEALAPQMLDPIYDRVRKRGRHIRRLDGEQRHALRKALKALRYAIELLAPLFPAKAVRRTRKSLAGLQDSFGALNDAVVLEAVFLQPDAPAASDPAACRAAGRVIGAVQCEARADWEQVVRRWKLFRKEPPFWS